MVAEKRTSNTPVIYLKMETNNSGISKAAISRHTDNNIGSEATALPKIRTKVKIPKRINPFLAPILLTITGAKIIRIASRPT
jgi:hypothetical protein